MPGLSHDRSLLLRLAALIAAVFAVAWTFAAPPAVAGPLDPIQIDATDPAGDARYQGKVVEPGADITGFSVTQDRAAAVVRGTVTFDGELASVGVHELRVALGLDDGYGGCIVSANFGWVHIRHDMGTDVADYVVGTITDIRKDVAVQRGDKQVSFTTPAAPDVFARGFKCIVVTTERLLGEGKVDGANPEDKVIGWAPPVVETPNAVVDPGKGVPAPILDADNDGVHDGIDKCPQVPGAATNGCESVPLAKSIRLGTKRVIIDRLMPTASGSCPATVKAVVTLKGKRLAAQKLGTLKKGKFCHVFAIVNLKKRVAKARVVITGAGLTSVAATVVK